MSKSRLHPSLPAPVVHNSYMTSYSKSSVLAGVQDAYWSDDEAEDSDCPLCLEEMDVSDRNFKPCPCGYQICRFCWNHIKENLNRRCPACRREYSDDAVQFKPIDKEDHRKLTQQKKQREKERKDLDNLGRRHLLNVRIVQRNVVYVVGLGSKFAKEELLSTLRSNEYFGRYGKITKILIVKRTSSGRGNPVVGLYISYYRREDAARAIAEVDGTASPSGSGETMRASHGTTKYCISFLRNVSCSNKGCMDLHDWGDENDCFTKEDLTTLKHSMKDTETSFRPSPLGKRQEDGNLPKSAAWGQKGAPGTQSVLVTNSLAAARDVNMRNRRGQRTSRSSVPVDSSKPTGTNRQLPQDRKQAAKTPSQPSISRPSTPSILPSSVPQRPPTPSSSKRGKARKETQAQVPAPPLPPRSPTSSVTVESDFGSGSQDVAISPVASPPVTQAVPVSHMVMPPSAPPGLPAVPPGLKVPASVMPMGPPPGLTSPSTPGIAHEEGPSSNYQMSSQARALLDDMKIRREASMTSSALFVSPFPDLDRTLQVLTSGDGDSGGFNFNLDPKLAVDDDHLDGLIPEFDANTNFNLSTNVASSFDPFASYRSLAPGASAGHGPPPGLSSSSSVFRPAFDPFAPKPASTVMDIMERQTSSSSGYTGSFNPFAESSDNSPLPSTPSRAGAAVEDDLTRRVSRFGFARERQGSGFSALSSPMLGTDASASEGVQSASSAHAPWPFQRASSISLDVAGPPPGLPARVGTPGSIVSRSSPLVSQAYPVPSNGGHGGPFRFQSYETAQSETFLKDMLGIGRDRNGVANDYRSPIGHTSPSHPFQDPAIMSSVPYVGLQPLDTSFSAVHHPSVQTPYSPRLGYMRNPIQPSTLVMGQGGYMGMDLGSNIAMESFGATGSDSIGPSEAVGFVPEDSPSPPPVLSSTDFPALPTAPVPESQAKAKDVQQPHILSTKDEKAQAKLDRRVARKIAAAERAAEKEREATEKAAEKVAAEKDRVEKAKEEKERLREERDRLAREKKEKAERERLDKEKERDRLALERKDNKAKGTAKGSSDSKANATATKGAKTSGRAQTSSIVDASPMPILSKMPKKNRPATKPLRIHKDDDSHSIASSIQQTSSQKSSSSTPLLPAGKIADSFDNPTPDESPKLANVVSRDQSESTPPTKAKSVKELLDEIDVATNGIYLPSHPFFDIQKLSAMTKTPVDTANVLRALSSFPADCAAGVLDDKTMASFRQLLETLTRTMSDLVQLLPQTTWGSIFDVLCQDLKNLKQEYTTKDASSFDGLMHDDLADVGGDDDLDLDLPSPTVDRRAKWMELQLAKLEELHRDVNTAAIRAILSSNDSGWNSRTAGALPHVGNTLSRFDQLGSVVQEDGTSRSMNGDELEKKLAVSKEAVIFAENELKEAMRALQSAKP